MKISVLSLFLLISVYAKAQYDFCWATQMSGSQDDVGYSVAVDLAGNVYNAGYFKGTCDLPWTTFDLVSSPGKFDIYISKQDPNGNLIWTKKLQSGLTIDMVEHVSIAVDNAQNVFITGSFRGTADVDPGPGIYNLVSTAPYNVLICKLDNLGNFVWAKKMGRNSSDCTLVGDCGWSIGLDPLGNIYICGYFSALGDFDPGLGTFYLTPNGGYDVFICKLNGSGDLLWVKNIGGTGNDKGNCLSIDGIGNIYMTGVFNSSVDFDPGPGLHILSASGTDIFVCKLNTNGDFVWAKKMGGSSQDNGTSIAIDKAGYSYITGNFREAADFDPGPGTHILFTNYCDVFISKLDPIGNFVWTKQFASTGYSNSEGNGIALDVYGNIYTTGTFINNIDLDPDSTSFFLSGSGGIFISKLDPAGNFLYGGSMGGTGWNRGHALAVDALCQIYITGSFGYATDINPNAGIYYIFPAGTYDAFLMKLGDFPGFTSIDEELTSDEAFALFPNPSNGICYIIKKEPGKSIVKVYNTAGDEVLVTQNDNFDLSEKPKGIYFVEVNAENTIGTKIRSIKKIVLN